MNISYPTLTEVLSQDFQKRKEKNRAYSLRAYGKHLGIARSTLNGIMLGKTRGSPSVLKKVAKKLALSDSDCSYLIYAGKLKRGNGSAADETKLRQKIIALDTRFNLVSEQDFEKIGYWEYFAVMELIKTKNAQFDSRWIARKLGISEGMATAALVELKRQKVIEISPSGGLTVLKDFIALPSGKRLDAARRFHAKVIKKGYHALKTVPEGTTRNISSTILRFRKSDLPKIDQFIKSFRRQLSAEFEAGDEHDAVFALGVQFCRVDRDIV